MALPATIPNWASDTNFSSGAESGNPTKASPGAPALAQGFVPGERFKAQRINYTLYWIIQHVLYLRGLVGEALTWTAAHIFNGASITGTSNIDMAAPIEGNRFLIDHATNTYDYKTPRADTLFLPLAGHKAHTGTLAWEQDMSSGKLVSTGAGEILIPIRGLPPGAVITSVQVGAEAPSGTVSIVVQKHAPAFLTSGVTVTTIGSTDVTVSTPYEILTTGAVTETFTGAAYYWLMITASAASQLVTAVAVTYNNPGPR